MTASVTLLFLIGEGFIGWSSRPSLVFIVLFIVGVRVGGGTPPLRSMQLPLKVINLLLQSSVIVPLLGYMTFPP